jgi:hypothetical protein
MRRETIMSNVESMRRQGWGIVLMAASVTAIAACGGGQNATTTTGSVTFWQDVAPIYNNKCVKCHQEGGIAPFRLDNFADAKTNAGAALVETTAETMPPYFVKHDGTCGQFHDEETLTTAEKSTIKSWVTGAQAEGTPVTLVKPGQPKLEGALDMATPMFSPVPQGGQLAQFDEYRCFLMDSPRPTDGFLTGYDVTPGEATIVHHVLMFVVDPQGQGQGGRTNAAIMSDLDAASPDRLGWPCFGAAGEGVAPTGVPITWAPGQGVVTYPDGMGVQIRTTDKLVVQVHYNLVDPQSAGKSDTTQIHLRFADSVNRPLLFLLPDPFLASLNNATPDTLPAGQADARYVWTRTGTQLGLGAKGPASVDLVSVMPHMHGRGVRQTMRIGNPGSLSCASELDGWDFHWQKFYSYKTYPTITATSQIEVTCEYDTRVDTMPVYPGWGTQNEMCLAVLMVALPPS